MNQMLEECRWVFNQTLALRKDAWEQDSVSVSLYQTNKLLTQWKRARPALANVYSQVLQDVQERVDLAFKAFFRRVKAGKQPGYPRFRGFGRYDSFSYPQFGFSLEGGTVKAAKVGEIKALVHRPLEGTPKTLTLRRHSTGKWYASFSCEVESTPLPVSEKAVGIDVGLTTFATLSTGDKIANPRFFRVDKRELAKVQRKLAVAEKGTPERALRRRAVSHVHERIANRRKNFAHQEARRLVNHFGVIAVEKLQVKDMMDDNWRSMNRSIGDAAWFQFRQCIQYKAEDAGRMYVEVEPRGTTQRCSRCQTLVPKDLSVRIHSCPVCGLVLDRDLNASYNILARGLASLGVSPRSSRL